MKTARTIFLISRTHGYQTHLLKKQDFIRLLGTKDLAEMSDILLKSEYSAELSRIPAAELTALQLEKIFYEKLSKRWYSLLKITSGKTKELLETSNGKLEIENLKRIIKAAHGRASISDEQLISIPREYQRVNSLALLVAETIEEVVELLRESPYRALRGRLEDYESSKNPALFDAELDKIYYDELWTKICRISNSRKTRALIGTEVDLRNLQWIVESKYMKLERWIVQENLVSLRHKLRKRAISRLMEADVQEMPQIPISPSYSELIRKAVEMVEGARLAEMENLFSQHLYSYVEKTLIRNPNDLVYVFSYLQLCFREAKNLTTLAIGKEMKMSENRLTSLLSV